MIDVTALRHCATLPTFHAAVRGVQTDLMELGRWAAADRIQQNRRARHHTLHNSPLYSGAILGRSELIHYAPAARRGPMCIRTAGRCLLQQSIMAPRCRPYRVRCASAPSSPALCGSLLAVTSPQTSQREVHVIL